MIYLDNAATTFPKPPQVNNAMAVAMRKYGANPGRSGHDMSIEAAEEIYRCRSDVSEFFNADGPECVAFTLNCTHATNMVLKGLLRSGDHVVTTCLEHNAITRPLNSLSRMGVTFTQVQITPEDNDSIVDAFRKAINSRTRLIVCIHASNVWGIRLPIERIAALGRQYGIPVLVDAAQTAGVLPIDVKDIGIDYLCTAGHKGLYGPMGTGILITKAENQLSTIIEGGTGTNSVSFDQPDTMPEKFESGTPNMPGISGLRAGINFINKKGMKNIADHEYKLIQHLYKNLSQIDGVKLYMPMPTPRYFVPVLSFNIREEDSETIAKRLNSSGIEVRAGLHCSPLAHEFCGTLDRGAVRICPSVFTNIKEINQVISVIKKVASK